MGTEKNIIKNMTSDSTGTAARKIYPDCTSIKNAAIIAPNTTNGERSKSLSVRLIPVCTWLESLVILVISVAVPIVSS